MKKLFAIIFGVILCFALGTAAWAADPTTLTVNNVKVVEAGVVNNISVDTFSYSDGVLTLNNYNGGIIYAEGNIEIVLKEGTTNNVVANSSNSHTAAIYVTGNLEISGSGTLNAKGLTDLNGNSYGIYASGNITISDATVNAIGGKYTSGGGNTYGIYAGGTLTVNSGEITAEIGNPSTAIGNRANQSNGIYAQSIDIKNGSVTAIGGPAKVSGGIRALNSVISGGSVTASGTNIPNSANNPTPDKNLGIYSDTISISGGTVTADGYAADYISSGLFTGNEVDSNGKPLVNGKITITGGNVTATGGSVGTNGKSYGISSINGSIDLDELGADSNITAQGATAAMKAKDNNITYPAEFTYRTAADGQPQTDKNPTVGGYLAISTPEGTDVPVTVIWVDSAENRNAVEVKMQMLTSNTPTTWGYVPGDVVYTMSDNSTPANPDVWTATYKMPKYNSEGKEITYGVEVSAPAGYTASYSADKLTVTLMKTPADCTLVLYGGEIYKGAPNMDAENIADFTKITVPGITCSGDSTNGYRYEFEDLNFETAATTAIKVLDVKAEIVLTGENNVKSGDAENGNSYGIYFAYIDNGASYAISGNGKLNVTAGKASGVEKISCGIYSVSDEFTISGDVEIISASGKSEKDSGGIYINGGIEISENAKVTAIGGNAEYISYGINASGEDVDLSGLTGGKLVAKISNGTGEKIRCDNIILPQSGWQYKTKESDTSYTTGGEDGVTVDLKMGNYLEIIPVPAYNLVLSGGKVYKDLAEPGKEIIVPGITGTDDGTAKYSFNNLNFVTAATTAIEVLDANAEIVLIGTNKIIKSGYDDMNGIYCTNDSGVLTFSGDGSLKIAAENVKGSPSDSYGIKSSGKIVVKDSAVIEVNGIPAVTDNNYGIYAGGDIDLSGLTGGKIIVKHDLAATNKGAIASGTGKINLPAEWKYKTSVDGKEQNGVGKEIPADLLAKSYFEIAQGKVVVTTPEQSKPEAKPEPCSHRLDENGKCSRCGIVIITYPRDNGEENPNTGAPNVNAFAVLLGAISGVK